MICRDLRDLVDGASGQGLGIRPVIVSPPPPGWDPEVDPPGSGTFTDPFHSITTGIAVSNWRRPVYLRDGQYVEPVEVTGVEGQSDRKVTISSYRNEPVTVDCFVPDFLKPSALANWEPGDGPDEFVWSMPLPDSDDEEVSCGEFLDAHQHTQPITYDHLEDLRSLIELDVRIEDPRPLDEVDPNEPPPGDNHGGSRSRPPAPSG